MTKVSKAVKSNKLAPFAVEVTDRDIKLGEPGDGEFCAIARSFKRLKLKNVDIGGFGEAYFTKGKLRYRVNLSKKAQRFIEKFDDIIEYDFVAGQDKPKHKVKPFKFVARPVVVEAV